MRESGRKQCSNCKGTGKVRAGKIAGICIYCKGKGWRTTSYGIDKND